MEKTATTAETIKTVIFAVVIAMLIRTFLFEPFRIPSASMYPNLYIGDLLFVSKSSYGYSKHSFPFSFAGFDGRIWQDKPQRGDIAVFKFPQDNKTDYIKTVIGLPGDKIRLEYGRLYINNKRVEREEVSNFVLSNKDGSVEKFIKYAEVLPEGKTHNILESSDRDVVDNVPEVIVPADNYFVMGDNRDRSDDSRMSVGFVPIENFVGRANLIFFSYDPNVGAWYMPWTWGKKVRWNRIFKKI